MHTKLAGDASFCPGRVFRKTIGLPATIVNPLDFRPHFFKMSPDTIYAKAYYRGDRLTALAAVTAGAQANMVAFEESFSTNVHGFVTKKTMVLANQTCKISNPKYQMIGGVGYRVQGSAFLFLFPDT
jgi:hypothetical protein